MVGGRRSRRMFPSSPRTESRLPSYELMAGGSLAEADLPDAAAEFGVARTPLAEGLVRSFPGR
jgi:hypothetical protein